MSQSGSATITVNPDGPIAPGETAVFDFRTFDGTGVPKKGWLFKRGPFDGVVFDSYSDVRLRGYADGMEAPIPGDSARTLDANPVERRVRVVNPSGSGVTVQPEDIEIILFGPAVKSASARSADRLRFSGAAVISDLVPGVTTDDGRR